MIITRKIWNWLIIARGDTFHWMIDAKRIIVTSSDDKVLPTPLRCLKAVFLKNLWKDIETSKKNELYVWEAKNESNKVYSKTSRRTCSMINISQRKVPIPCIVGEVLLTESAIDGAYLWGNGLISVLYSRCCQSVNGVRLISFPSSKYHQILVRQNLSLKKLKSKE